jgi:hypothetical protein
VVNGGNKIMVEFPFKEDIIENSLIRTFDKSVCECELTWHRDKEDRVIEIIENSGWLFQYDNELPFLLEGTINIKKESYHRVIKGDGILKVKVTKK